MSGTRVIIFGTPGSGKTQFALKLAEKRGLPLTHLDDLFFVRQWVEREREEFLDLQRALVNQPSWIIDGNAMDSLEMRFSACDEAFYFDFPPLLCLWRALKRSIIKKEPITWKFITYLLKHRRRYRAKIAHLRAKYPHVTFHLVVSDREIGKFLNSKA